MRRLLLAYTFWVLASATGWPQAAARQVEVPPLYLPHSIGEFQRGAPPSELVQLLQNEEPLRLTSAQEGAQDELEAMRNWNEAGNRPRQVGITRILPMPVVFRHPAPQGPATQGVVSGLYASSLTGTPSWGFRLQVEGAGRVRVLLSEVELPAGTRLWVWSDLEDPIGFGPELIDYASRTLWSPSVEGDTLLLGVELPDDAEEGDFGFRVTRVAELFPETSETGSFPMRSDSTLFSVRTQETSCIIDGTCVDSSTLSVIEQYRRAVAYLVFVEGNAVFNCSGALLNDTQSSFTPYLLTANHCFSSQSTASNLEAFWDYRTSSCGGNPPSMNTVPRTIGSNLLATSIQSDFTLVQMHSVPGNRVFLGWTTFPVPSGEKLYRLSHPKGEPQRFSTSKLTTTPESPCWNVNHHLYSVPDDGGTLSGSSGAPVILPNGQVVGQLVGQCGLKPEDGCAGDANYQVDGRFTSTFASISSFLDPAPAGEPCSPGPTVMCIDDKPGDRRFRIQVQYETVQGGGLAGPGQSVPLAGLEIHRGGIFWFFAPDNPELLIKVLNGCGVNNRYWVFYSAGTNVGLEIQVTDTSTGQVRTYTNPDLNPAPPVQDVQAFPCN